MGRIYTCESEELKQNVFEKDLKYIQAEIISMQPNGCYCKFSRQLRTVSRYNFRQKDYLNYWLAIYKNEPEYKQKIYDACMDKLTNGLTPVDEMIELIKNSDDKTADVKNSIESLTKMVKPPSNNGGV